MNQLSLICFEYYAHFNRQQQKQLFKLTTVAPRFNEPLYNEVLGITNDFLQPKLQQNVWKRTST